MATNKVSAYTKIIAGQNVKSNLVVSNHQISTWSEDSDGGSYTKSSTGTVNVTKSGYYPLAVVGTYVSGTNAQYLSFFRARLSAKASGQATVQYGLMRDSNVAHPNSVWYVHILWAKE